MDVVFSWGKVSMKKFLLFLLKAFLIVFVAFGCLGVYVMLSQSDIPIAIFFMVWSLIGFILLIALVRKTSQGDKSRSSSDEPNSFSGHNDDYQDCHINKSFGIPSQSIESNAVPDKSNYLKDSSAQHSNFSNQPTPIDSAVVRSPESPVITPVKTERHNIAGTSYRQKEIESLGEENYLYSLGKKELIDDFMTDQKIYKYDFFPVSVELVDEPDNPHDPNAIKVIIDGIHVGYIKKGSCSHIKKLVKNDLISSISAEIHGGRYKYISSDYDPVNDKDVYSCEQNSTPYFVSIDLSLKN